MLEAARIDPDHVGRELGGLSPGKRHAADLACDALHRALSKVWGTEGSEAAAPAPDRVLVAMSGGVDSAAAALLALRDGHEVVAVTLKLWADSTVDGSRSCCSPQAVLGARALAHSMGLPHLTLDLQQRFGDAVIADFIGEHARGRTPNPCVRCNGLVRFDAMLALAERVGARALVTGHYARIVRDADGPLLARAADAAKDQSYMLAGLRPELLERVVFPLGELTKPEVRALAREAGLPVAEKPESQDLCFLTGTTQKRFLARHGGLEDRSGAIVDSAGRPLGRHRGHRHFTVGQRRGLGVAAGEPLYVLATDPASNLVVAGPREELAAQRVEAGAGRAPPRQRAHRRRETPLSLGAGRVPGRRLGPRQARAPRARARRARLRRRGGVRPPASWTATASSATARSQQPSARPRCRRPPSS